MSDPTSAEERLRCAEINFRNVVKMNPAVGAHPIFMLAMDQLRDGLKKLEAANEAAASD